MEQTVKAKKKSWFSKDQLFFMGMVLPGILFLIVFSYGPMFGLLMAFQKYVPAKGVTGSEFVGLENFKYLINLPDVWQVTYNTVFIAVFKIIFNTVIPIAFAILLNEIRVKWMKKSMQTIVYLPHFLSWVILASVVVNLFNLDGTVNQILNSIGIDNVNFLGSNKVFPHLLIWSDVWKEFGYNSIVFLAAITSIDPGLYEAATMDGASWSQRVRHVTLPGMMPFIILMTILALPNILNAGFDQVYNLYSPPVYQSGDILDTYVYRIGLIGRDYSLGTAVGLIKSIIGLVLIVVSNRIAEKKTNRIMF
ncbi:MULTISPECIES: ABC transporter permease subunit [unclassified Enterococcus]|uniref:ABC transporter permease n=1 Tax=unclassified Enterococcus TaxID=2608891 RepID=UPI001553BAD6|nr:MULTISPECIES: ABC transporter permease subunit [unclassified Enterococcus]MBS7577947.1 sugar ABC transporter permease [Enterococcus sp. MMGLQ5-2]MBS7585192.1 sugar ABC transporter permease [Enterococcus sp. MMGLQ5-1]NPD13049.1 sugar ABC transporter permease [Enterococcus sp. MMGLQ5-1]NPD37777.1 sugar ABC transporter permease [Enterococcus sp. MMGLQ5-2]